MKESTAPVLLAYSSAARRVSSLFFLFFLSLSSSSSSPSAPRSLALSRRKPSVVSHFSDRRYIGRSSRFSSARGLRSRSGSSPLAGNLTQALGYRAWLPRVVRSRGCLGERRRGYLSIFPSSAESCRGVEVAAAPVVVLVVVSARVFVLFNYFSRRRRRRRSSRGRRTPAFPRFSRGSSVAQSENVGGMDPLDGSREQDPPSYVQRSSERETRVCSSIEATSKVERAPKGRRTRRRRRERAG